MKLLKCLILLLLCCRFASAGTTVSPLSCFDCPNITYETEKVVMPNCGKTDGGISGLTIHSDGTKNTYTWRDAAGAIVGHNVDLPDRGEGTYRLEVSDNSGCGSSAFSRFYFLKSVNAITLNDDKPDIHTSGCNNDGYIKGIKVTNATLYTWREFSGATYTSTTSPDLLNVPVGTYKLTATNGNGCIAESQSFMIGPDFVVPQVLSVEGSDQSCTDFNINIAVKMHVAVGGPELVWFFAADDDPTNGHLIEGRIFGNTDVVTAKYSTQVQGKYNFFVQLDNSCPVKLTSYQSLPWNMQIDADKSTVINDRCNQHKGVISPVVIGFTATKGKTLSYRWTDVATGKVISQQKTLRNVGAGQYELYAVFEPTCRDRYVFTITDNSPAIVPPLAIGTTLCLPGLIGIHVTNPDTAAIYKLYASAQDTVAIDSNATGEFYRKVTRTTDFYLTRKHGDCESDRTKITETVVAAVDIPNTFTPNNDGQNDYWKLTGIEDFPGADVKVFDRYGHMVFNSVGYGTPFDGQSRGHLLPSGVYYYIIDLKQRICYGKIAGSLTILH